MIPELSKISWELVRHKQRGSAFDYSKTGRVRNYNCEPDFVPRITELMNEWAGIAT